MKLPSSIRKNSPLIFSIAASIGVVATGVTSAISGYKLREKEESRTTLTSQSDRDIWIDRARTFAAPVCLGALTIGCIVSGNRIDARTKAQLAAACMGSAATARDLVTRVAKDEHIDLYKPLADVPNDEAKIFFEEFTGRIFEARPSEVQAAEMNIVNDFVENGYATMNEFYSYLGLSNTLAGDLLGWTQLNLDDPYLIFGEPMFDNIECTGDPSKPYDYIISTSWTDDDSLSLDHIECGTTPF